MNSGPTQRQEVRAMICHRDVDLGILCLGSLLRFCQDPIQIILHEDGSLTAQDRDKLAQELPQATVLSKAEADERMEPVLAQYPRCRAFRQRSVNGMKLLDPAYFASGDIILLDTDVLFFRPFKSAFTWPDDGVQCLFLHDRSNAYCLRPWETRNLRIINQFNAGTMMIRRQNFSFAEMERLLGRIEDSETYIRNEPCRWFLEQTCWAAVAARVESRAWKPRQMRVIRPHDRYDETLIAGHFVKSVRHKLCEFNEQARRAGSADLPPVAVGLVPAHLYSTPRFLANRIVNRVANLMRP